MPSVYFPCDCIQKPKHLSSFPQEMFEKGHTGRLCGKNTPRGRRVAGMQEGELASQLLLAQLCTVRLAILIGANTQTHSFRGTHRSKASLNVMFSYQLYSLPSFRFSWEVCLNEGWLYMSSVSDVCTWDVRLIAGTVLPLRNSHVGCPRGPLRKDGSQIRSDAPWASLQITI